MDDVLWHTDIHTLSPVKAAALTAARIFYRVIGDFMQGQLTLRAMSLVYTTLLSLVPLLALSFSVLKAFGVHNQLEPMLLGFLAPLGEKSAELAGQIVQFVENMGVGVLGSLGLVLLIYTVVSLIQKVEAAFNFIWHVSSLRSLAQRLSGYISVVMVGPMLVVTALGITASVASTALVRELIAIEPFGMLFVTLSKLVPYLLVIGAFTATYLVIPNTTVRFRSALIGGIVAGVLWESVGWGFTSFVVGSAKYKAVYSGFAIIILFLVWLYLNWLVLLLGASIAFYHQNPAYQIFQAKGMRLGSRGREALALEMMRRVGEAYQNGDNQGTLENIATQLSLPLEVVSDVSQILLSYGLLVQAGDQSPYFVPGRDLQKITVKEVLDAVGGEPKPEQSGVNFAGEAVVEVLQQLDEATQECLEDKTIKDLLVSKESQT
jgi:membrane protein